MTYRGILVNRSRSGLFLGLLIVAIGIVLLLDQTGIVSAHYVYSFFWPAIFIFFGTEFLISSRCAGGRGLVGFLLLAFGLLLLAGALGWLNVGFHTLWPVALIIWGIWIVARVFSIDRGPTAKINGAIHDSIHDRIRDSLHERIDNTVRERIDATAKKVGASTSNWADAVKGAVRESMDNWTGKESTDPEFDYMAIFGAIKQRVTVKNFRGGRLTALFGGFEVDLTRADIEGQTAVIDASALMGGGEIRVPYSWAIEIQGLALLGGYTDETHQEISDSATAKRLIVKGIAALGGVVIKN
ncbi:MAG TPA: DUF5668 domain-containing protein [Candidatus Cybelea sp.]|nr:DUF5668 domain-containing protein [Candidatus Cybelea sp.]